jgi:N-acetylglucosamine kinase-like BadF-type ATPase
MEHSGIYGILMWLYLGIDGGQTETRGILATEEGRILGIGRSGPCQHPNQETARKQVHEALCSVVRSALVGAGLPETSQIRSAFLGVTGVTGPTTAAALFYRSILSENFKVDSLTVDIDARSALAGAIPEQAGIVAISGTGSIAFGIDPQGNEARAGGWGYLIGDHGSGFEIGQQALAAVLGAHERVGPGTVLTSMVLKDLGIEDVGLIPHLIHLKPHPKIYIAKISGLVLQAAQQGDQVAQKLMKTAGKQLASLVLSVLQRLQWTQGPIPVSGVGGVLRSSVRLWKSFCDELARREPRTVVTPPELPPLAGALLLAYRQDRLPGIAERIERLHDQLLTKDYPSNETRN